MPPVRTTTSHLQLAEALPFQERRSDRRSRGYVALNRYIPEIDTVFVLAVRSQREAGIAGRDAVACGALTALPFTSRYWGGIKYIRVPHDEQLVGRNGPWRSYAETDVELDRVPVRRHSPRYATFCGRRAAY